MLNLINKSYKAHQLIISLIVCCHTQSLVADNQQSELAISQYQHKIAELTLAQNKAYPGLIEPLVGLGLAYLHSDAPASSIPLFEQAIQISRLQNGLHSDQQLPIVENLTEAYAALQDWSEVYKRQRYLFFLQLRRNKQNTEAIVDAMHHLAEWSIKAGKLEAAQAAYVKMIKLIERRLGAQHPSLVRALTGLSSTYIEQRNELLLSLDFRGSIFSGQPLGFILEQYAIFAHQQGAKVVLWSRGEQALRHAVALNQINPETSALSTAQSHIKLGDWHILFDQTAQAIRQYNQAIALMGTPAYQDDLADLFGEPTLLYFPSLKLSKRQAFKDKKEQQEHSGFIEFFYNVDYKGQLQELEVISAEPVMPSSLEIKKIALLARYRPALQPGATTQTAKITYRYDYRY